MILLTGCSSPFAQSYPVSVNSVVLPQVDLRVTKETVLKFMKQMSLKRVF